MTLERGFRRIVAVSSLSMLGGGLSLRGLLAAAWAWAFHLDPPRRAQPLALVTLLTVLLPMSVSAQGWYLLVPPPLFVAPGEVIPNWDAPLDSWDQWRAFDTVAECEDERGLLQNVVLTLDQDEETAVRRIKGHSQRVRTLRESFRRSSFLAETVKVGRCVSAGDPRLAPRPRR